jgi:hypothetical protein
MVLCCHSGGSRNPGSGKDQIPVYIIIAPFVTTKIAEKREFRMQVTDSWFLMTESRFLHYLLCSLGERYG